MGYRIGAIIQDTLPGGTVYNRRQTAAELASLQPNPYGYNPYMTPPNPYGAQAQNPYAQYGSQAQNPYAQYQGQNPYGYYPTPYGYTDPYSMAYAPSPYGYPVNPYGY